MIGHQLLEGVSIGGGRTVGPFHVMTLRMGVGA
jgi:hypothetical protein